MTIKDNTDGHQLRTRYLVNKNETEQLGLKHYLGNVNHLPFSDEGLAISKSSFILNQLQNKIADVQKLQSKMQEEKIKELREQLIILNCPYYGQGRQDLAKLRMLMNKSEDISHSQLSASNKQDELFEIGSSRIQIVTDKNDFLTGEQNFIVISWLEKEKNSKIDNEKKKKEKFEEAKLFLSNNNLLSNSIINKAYFSRSTKAGEDFRLSISQEQEHFI